MGDNGDTRYPADWETDAILSDGSTVRIRPIRPDDSDLLAAFHERQSPESIYFRFFQYRPELSDRELEFFTNVDYERRMAFVALLGDEFVAVARYETIRGQNIAEVAFFVDDGYHGRGLATLMLEYLAAAGRRRQLSGFIASVLPENYGMLRVFRQAGFDVSTSFDDGAISVTLGIEVTDQGAAAIAARERRAQARSVARLLEPRSVAVIGASRRPESVGHRLLRNMVDASFEGSIQVVNPTPGTTIAGLQTVARVEDLDRPIDLAIIAVPAAEVEDVVQACIARKVAGLLVMSAGFAEVGGEGVERQRRLVELAREHGVRLIGPNAFGIANTDPAIQMRALYMPVEVAAGSVGLLSQSGPLGAALLGQLGRAAAGISSFAAVGNRADVSVNDLLQYWAEDERTKAIALYLDNVGNVAKFTQIARAVSAHKPIIAAVPHDPELSELLRQSGVILVREVAELAEQAGLAVHQPVPRGRRVVIVSNSSSVARLAVAACRNEGLEVVVPANVRAGGDAVLLGDADRPDLDHLTFEPDTAPVDYERLVVSAAVSSEVDVVLVALLPTAELSGADLAAFLGRVDRAVDKPMVAAGLAGIDDHDLVGMPLFDFPEGAARTLGRWAAHGEWLRREPGDPVELDDAADVEATFAKLLGDEPERSLDQFDASRLLAVLGVDLAPSRLVADTSQALAAAEDLGYPVALKAGGRTNRVAGEAGGTALDLHDERQLTAAFDRMSATLDGFLPGIVQSMVPTGPHLRIEVQQEADSGARLSVGIGGRSLVGLPAREVQVLPAGRNEIRNMVSAPWLSDALQDTGALPALDDLLERLAGAAGLLPGLRRMALNPVLVSSGRVIVVEAEIELCHVERGPLDDVRHL